LDSKLIESIKSSTVGLGLVEKNQYFPKAVFGSGFFVRPEGYIMTAQHVLDNCIEWYQFLNRRSITVEFVAFHIRENPNTINLDTIPLKIVSRPSRPYGPGEYPGPDDPDIGYAIPNEKVDVSYLKFKQDGKTNLYDEICITGYPAGGQSLDPQKKFGGMRFNPVVQFGHISGYMPHDNSPMPYGLQTDIVGTAGSSGSPIVELKTGLVLGFAQQVFTTDINFTIPPFELTKSLKTEEISASGTAKIGLIYGLTAFQFPDFPDKLKGFVEDNVPLYVKFRSSNLRIKELRKIGDKPWLP
jgi:hypothetical protein